MNDAEQKHKKIDFTAEKIVIGWFSKFSLRMLNRIYK